jgi:hypothetical protein
VGDSVECDNALAVFVVWYVQEGGESIALRKGIASFAFSADDKIISRTTLIYYEAMK